MNFPEDFRQGATGTRFASMPGDPRGMFIIPARYACGRPLKVIATDGDTSGTIAAHLGGWEHVSVSIVDRRDRCPTWPEMCAVKNLFWNPDECVVQFHPSEADYIDMHPGVLHLWRATREAFPMPPKICV